MKQSGRDLARFIAKPEPDRLGVLLYGGDAMRVAIQRQDLLKALVGDHAEEEMRLTRLPASELRKDPAKLNDALKARGFFPGPCAVFVEDANENIAPAVLAAMQDWQKGDATLVVAAGALKPTSKIRKAFEAHNNAYAAAIYDDPMDRAEIESRLREAGLALPDRDAMGELESLASALDPGDMRQVIEKLTLYKLSDASPITVDDIAAVAPASTEAALDEILHIVAEGRAAEIGPLMARLSAQGQGGVAICIALTRHFKALYAAASDPRGPQAGIASMRPPVFWKNRERMTRQAQNWGGDKLARALGELVQTDLTLRSSQRAPDRAVMERALIRLAMLAKARG